MSNLIQPVKVSEIFVSIDGKSHHSYKTALEHSLEILQEGKKLKMSNEVFFMKERGEFFTAEALRALVKKEAIYDQAIEACKKDKPFASPPKENYPPMSQIMSGEGEKTFPVMKMMKYWSIGEGKQYDTYEAAQKESIKDLQHTKRELLLSHNRLMLNEHLQDEHSGKVSAKDLLAIVEKYDSAIQACKDKKPVDLENLDIYRRSA